MKLLLLTIISVLFFIDVSAQKTHSAKGFVTDSSSNQKLSSASVIILNAADSIIQKFARTNDQGYFEISNIPTGKYLLLINYPEYTQFVDHFTLDSNNTNLNFGNINLILRSKLLKEVIIKGERNAIKIKGDTTEFDAKGYRIQPNAKVEDLLKQLPGLQVDRNGQITANGQRVDKVLLDGEEFFADDPTLVTRNIRADMVDKVQIYDKKSAQASFTGVEDNNKIKTIDIKLKEDKKYGSFGKLDGGIGTNNFYQNQLMYNTFRDKLKFSVYGTLSNTGKTGLGWREAEKYGSSSDNVEMLNGGALTVYVDDSDELETSSGSYNGEGIPTAKSGGLHFSNKWKNDTRFINTNYKIGSLAVSGTKNVLSQNNLPTSIQFGNSDEAFDRTLFRQKLDMTYIAELDSTSNIQLIVDGAVNKTKVDNVFTSNSTNEKGNLLNTNDRVVNNDSDGEKLHASFLYTKKFQKKGRGISVLIDQSYQQNSSEGFLKSHISFFNLSKAIDSTATIDQYKSSVLSINEFKTNLTYNEALTKSLSVVLSYGFSLLNNKANRNTFNFSASGSYNDFDPLLSNDYKFNRNQNEAGAILTMQKGKSTYTLGTKALNEMYDQLNKVNNERFRRNFLIWSPQAGYAYKFSAQGNFRINYMGSNLQPTIDQLQPVRINNDPLNVVIGNQSLRPSFKNVLYSNFTLYKPLNRQMIFLNAVYGFTSKAIASKITTTAAGKSTYEFINLANKNATNFSVNGYFGRHIKKIDMNLGLQLNAVGLNSYSYINDVQNKSTFANYSINLNISKSLENYYDLSASFGPAYTVSKTSLQTITNTGGGINANATASIYLPFGLEIGGDADYQYRNSTASFPESFERLLVNASLKKTFLKDKNLALTLTGYDLLNQNKGFERNLTNSFLTETRFTNVNRYFMLSLVWDFNRMGGKK